MPPPRPISKLPSLRRRQFDKGFDTPHPIVAVIPVLSSASASKVNLAGGVACAELIKAETSNGTLQTNGAALYRTRAADVPADTSFMDVHAYGHDFGLNHSG
ncbi:hypothetical protein EYF80_056575 [Liparis tanakae]|uniref:Uncharacterized protein n=1 Tax=Liparis tanakae TaxID=230148 RepID=A0A4Z2EXG3_9TELE|nr:hypothetical protein EYF80_056575 [Liparis tanakae]